MGKNDRYLTTTNQCYARNVCIFLEMYCLFLRTKESNMIDIYFTNKWDILNDIS